MHAAWRIGRSSPAMEAPSRPWSIGRRSPARNGGNPRGARRSALEAVYKRHTHLLPAVSLPLPDLLRCSVCTHADLARAPPPPRRWPPLRASSGGMLGKGHGEAGEQSYPFAASPRPNCSRERVFRLHPR
jgi:hypothetical protein